MAMTQQGQTQTFRDLQRQGHARPGPGAAPQLVGQSGESPQRPGQSAQLDSSGMVTTTATPGQPSPWGGGGGPMPHPRPPQPNQQPDTAQPFQGDPITTTATPGQPSPWGPSGPTVQPPPPPPPGGMPGGGGGPPGTGLPNLGGDIYNQWAQYQGAGGFGGGQGGQVDAATQQAIMQSLSNPSAYGAPQVMQAFESMNQRLGQGFDQERQNINEDAARRGLSFSSIPVGRMGDVGVRQAQAQSDLATNLLTDQARTFGQDRAQAINQGMGFGGQQFGQGLAGYQANLGANQQNFGQRQALLGNLLGFGQQQFGNQLDTARFNADQDMAQQLLLLRSLGLA